MARRSGPRRTRLGGPRGHARTLTQCAGTARGILWQNAAQFHVSAREITTIEDELEAVYGLLMRAKAAGVPVNVSYVA